VIVEVKMSYRHICGCDMETGNTYHMLVENLTENGNT
jgi:hypothetical protein